MELLERAIREIYAIKVPEGSENFRHQASAMAALQELLERIKNDSLHGL